MGQMRRRSTDFVEAQAELVRRSIPGAMSYFGLLLVVGLLSPYRLDHPKVFYFSSALFLCIGIVRLVLTKLLQRRGPLTPRWAQTAFRWGVLTNAFFWGIFSALTLGYYSHEWTGMIVLLMSAGIAAVGHSALTPDLVLSRSYFTLLLTPSIVVAALAGNAAGYSMAMTIGMFGGFLFMDAGRQYENFWQAIDDRASLRAKAVELEEAKKLADEGTIAKSNFLAKMSHEIRTPMNAVIGMTELLLDSGLDTQRERFVHTIKDSSESLLEIVNDILDLSKIEAGRIELDMMDFDLRDSVHDVLRVLSLRAHTKGLELSCRVRPDVPYALFGDGGRLRQILVNLVGNAIKFTPQGSVLVQIECDEKHEDGVILHFAVSDTGIGIPQEHLLRIFEPFAQADSSTTRQYGGTGLGLSISKALVEMMRGKIWCESHHGNGSTFHFTAHFALRKGMSRSSVFTGAASLSDLQVLVVDDAPENARILGEMIQSWRMHSTIVQSNDMAIENLDRSRTTGPKFDFVLVDAQMAGESGFSLAEYIVGQPDLPSPIMMLTSVGQAGAVDRCQKLGLKVYLIKPVSESDLFDAMMSMRGSRQGPHEVLEPPVDSPTLSRQLSILVAEDNAVNQQVAQQMLQRRGYAVTIASNGREAVELVSESASFDLILMDIQMPEMDGFQATAAIREREKAGVPRIPIVAMTAHAMKGDRERCLQAGMDGYISKPVQSKILYETIEAITAKRLHLVASTPEPTPEPVHLSASVVNLNEMLERIDGNLGLLQSIISIFQEDHPAQLRRIKEAVAAGDATTLTSVAHTLKGSLLALAADRAAAAALELEKLGRQSHFEGARELVSTLESEVEMVSAEFEKILKERVGVGAAT
jgi:signal transduction histidine kinase/DNA-binding response OmpR family regulator